LFDWSGLLVRRSLLRGPLLLVVVALTVVALTVSLRAQEMTEENPTTGTIQGTVRDDVGSPVAGARVLYNSAATDTKGLTRTGKDGTYVSEAVPPGAYVVLVEGRDMLPAESNRERGVGRGGHGGFQVGMDQPGAGATGE